MRALREIGKRRATESIARACWVKLGCGDGRNKSFVMALHNASTCLLYTSDAADERSSVDLGGRRIIKKTKRGWQNGRAVETSD